MTLGGKCGVGVDPRGHAVTPAGGDHPGESVVERVTLLVHGSYQPVAQRQVGRTDVHGIDAGNGEDRVDVVDRLVGLDHRDAGDDVVGCRREVRPVSDPRESSGPMLRDPPGGYRQAATAPRASSGELTIGTITPSAPASSTRPMIPGSFHGTRTNGTVCVRDRLQHRR